MQEGAIPPFGSMFGMPLFLDADVGKWPTPETARIAFNAGAPPLRLSPQPHPCTP